MKIFPSLPSDAKLPDVFQRFPNIILPLLELSDRILRDQSPLTVAERELIAAYVSGLNACRYCFGGHQLAAEAFGVDPVLFDGLMENPDSSEVGDQLKPILDYVRKLTESPSRISSTDAERVYAVGWDEQALFDAISVCALFNFMNRLVEGSGIAFSPLEQSESEKQMIRDMFGRKGSDANESDHRYADLAKHLDVRRGE